jgi:hypothetical protein
VKAAPARGLRTRLMRPSSPMAMPTMWALRDWSSIMLQDGEIVGQAAGGGDDFDEVGLEGGDALGGLIEAVGAAGAGEVVRTDQESGAGGAEGGAELGQLGRVHCSADSTSKSTMWQPVSAALRRISSSEFRDPVNWPPKACGGRWRWP